MKTKTVYEVGDRVIVDPVRTLNGYCFVRSAVAVVTEVDDLCDCNLPYFVKAAGGSFCWVYSDGILGLAEDAKPAVSVEVGQMVRIPETVIDSKCDAYMRRRFVEAERWGIVRTVSDAVGIRPFGQDDFWFFHLIDIEQCEVVPMWQTEFRIAQIERDIERANRLQQQEKDRMLLISVQEAHLGMALDVLGISADGNEMDHGRWLKDGLTFELSSDGFFAGDVIKFTLYIATMTNSTSLEYCVQTNNAKANRAMRVLLADKLDQLTK